MYRPISCNTKYQYIRGSKGYIHVLPQIYLEIRWIDDAISVRSVIGISANPVGCNVLLHTLSPWLQENWEHQPRSEYTHTTRQWCHGPGGNRHGSGNAKLRGVTGWGISDFVVVSNINISDRIHLYNIFLLLQKILVVTLTVCIKTKVEYQRIDHVCI